MAKSIKLGSGVVTFTVAVTLEFDFVSLCVNPTHQHVHNHLFKKQITLRKPCVAWDLI